MRSVRPAHLPLANQSISDMHEIIYLIGLVVVVMFVLGLLGCAEHQEFEPWSMSSNASARRHELCGVGRRVRRRLGGQRHLICSPDGRRLDRPVADLALSIQNPMAGLPRRWPCSGPSPCRSCRSLSAATSPGACARPGRTRRVTRCSSATACTASWLGVEHCRRGLAGVSRRRCGSKFRRAGGSRCPEQSRCHRRSRHRQSIRRFGRAGGAGSRRDAYTDAAHGVAGNNSSYR